jgi:hypothetical protein
MAVCSRKYIFFVSFVDAMKSDVVKETWGRGISGSVVFFFLEWKRPRVHFLSLHDFPLMTLKIFIFATLNS